MEKIDIYIDSKNNLAIDLVSISPLNSFKKTLRGKTALKCIKLLLEVPIKSISSNGNNLKVKIPKESFTLNIMDYSKLITLDEFAELNNKLKDILKIKL